MEIITDGSPWMSFVLQVLVILVPVGVAFFKQNGRIKALEKERDKLRSDFNDLSQKHETLQKKYEASLIKQAGMRDGF